MSSRRKVKNNRGSGLLNTLINTLPVELHLPGYQFCGPGTDLKKRLSHGQTGINKLDAACRDHDIAYETSNLSEDRRKADRVLENRAWENFKSRDSGFGEKAASWTVTSAMKAKRQIGGGFKNIVGVAKKALGKSMKACRGSPNIALIIKSAIDAARAHVQKLKTCRQPRVINVPKTGGALALIPILAGLSALGTLAGGAANVIKTIRDITSKRGSSIQLGGGLYLEPYTNKSGDGLSYKIVKNVKKNNKTRNKEKN